MELYYFSGVLNLIFFLLILRLLLGNVFTFMFIFGISFHCKIMIIGEHSGIELQLSHHIYIPLIQIS